MDTPDFDVDAQACLTLLEVSKRIKVTIEAYATEHDLTLQQIMVLHNLYNEDHILMGALADRLHCDASNVTGMVDRLQAAGLISRQALPEDRRAKQLAITVQGRQLIDRLIPRLPRELHFSALTADEHATLRQLLRKILT